MKRWSLTTAALLLAIGTMAQGLPQFAYNSYEGWSEAQPLLVGTQSRNNPVRGDRVSINNLLPPRWG